MAFHADVHLMLSNAFDFNDDCTPEFIAATMMQQVLSEALDDLEQHSPDLVASVRA